MHRCRGTSMPRPPYRASGRWRRARRGSRRRLSGFAEEAGEAVISGARVLILSDRAADHENVPVPMLLAVGAVHHHLIRIGKRMRAGIVCETGEARDVHHMACLIGYGAGAVYPYVAYDTCREVLEKSQAAAAAES